MLTDKFWNKYFKVYDVLRELYPYQELLNGFIKEIDIKNGSKILDAGAGTGNLSQKIHSLGGEIFTIDISVVGTRRLLEKIPEAKTCVGSLCDTLPYADNFFDAIVSNNVIYTLPKKDRAAVAREFYRVLKPGGRIVVSNISPGFSPIKIYSHHIKKELVENGFQKAFCKILKFLHPTSRMFWYNARIKKENKGGDYAFLDKNEQFMFLDKGGFRDIVFIGKTYADQAVMHKARK